MNSKNHVRGAAEDRCLLAVVGGRQDRANEVVACFARQGDRVHVLWYADTRQLLSTEPKPRFGAVIFFGEAHGDTSDAEEVALRSVLPGIPLYRL